MAIGSWDPAAPPAAASDPVSDQTLQRFIRYSRDQQLDELERLLSDSEQRDMAGLMRLEHAIWQRAIADYSDDDLVLLLRFFAVAEHLPGWEAGAKSPVIAIARVLRERGLRLQKPLLLWLRQVNDNRFLPYGPL